MKLYTTIAMLFGATAAYCQPALEWAKNWGSNRVDEGVSIVCDQTGNTYICGYYCGDGDFDPDPTRQWQLKRIGGTDIFVQKFDANGNLLWVMAHGGSTKDMPYGIVVDEKQNVYVAALWERARPDSEQLEEQIGLFCLDVNGKLLWEKSHPMTAGTQIGNMQFDQSGLIHLGTHLSVHNSMVLAFDRQGNAVADKGIAAYQKPFTLFKNRIHTLDQKNRILAYDFDTKALLWSLTPTSANHKIEELATDNQGNLFLAANNVLKNRVIVEKISHTGEKLWTKEFEAAQQITGVVVSITNKVYITGKKDGNIVVFQVDTQGNLLWETGITNTQTANIYNIALHPLGGIVATGYFSEAMENSLLIPNGKQGANDGFLLRWQGENEQPETQSVSGFDAPTPQAILYTCYPNPTQHQCTAEFSVEGLQEVKINVYDANGKFIHCFFTGTVEGEHRVTLDLSQYPSGTYFCQLQTPTRSLIQPVIVARS